MKLNKEQQDEYHFRNYNRTFDLFDMKSSMIRLGVRFIRRDQIHRVALSLLPHIPCFCLTVVLKDGSIIEYSIHHSYETAKELAEGVAKAAL